MKSSILYVSLCTSVVVLLSGQVHSLELQSVAYAETRYSDNAGSLKQQRRHDIRNTVGIDSELSEQRQSMEADISVSIEHARYMRDTGGDRTSVTSGLGLLNLNLVEDFLHWNTTYIRTRLLEDASQEEELEDRNYRNTLTSGPQMTLELTDTSDLDAHVYYVNVENSDDFVSDSERANGEVSLRHHYNQLTQFNLTSRYETILTEDEMDPYDRKSGSVGITRALVRGLLALNVGRSILTPELGGSVGSNFYQASFSRDDFLHHVLQVGYTQDVSDTSIGFLDEALVEEDTGALPDNDYVTRKRWFGSISRVFGVHSYTFSGARSDSRYELSRQQTLLHSGSFRYERQVIEHLLTGGSLSYSRRNYVGDPVRGIDETFIYTIDSMYQFSERFNAGSFIRFISRETTGSQGNNYEEFQLGVDLRYRIL